MKNVLVHSIRHTGTWFVIHLLEAAYGKEKTWITMPGGIRKRILKSEPQQTLESIIDPDEKRIDRFFNRNVLKGVTAAEKEKFSLLILHTHYENTNAGMMQSLIKHHPHMKIIMPFRNPLLSLCTKIWREFNTLDNYKSKKNENQRLHFANMHIEKFKNMLDVPKNNIFIFPIDLKMDINQKMMLYKSLYSFAGLPESEAAENIVNNWKPVNKTVDCYQKEHSSMYHDILRVAVDGHTGVKNDGEIFETIKREAINGQSTLIQRVLSVEFAALKQRKQLKQKLIAMGYDNLSW